MLVVDTVFVLVICKISFHIFSLPLLVGCLGITAGFEVAGGGRRVGDMLGMPGGLGMPGLLEVPVFGDAGYRGSFSCYLRQIFDGSRGV